MEKVDITTREQFREILVKSEIFNLWTPETQKNMLKAVAGCPDEKLLAAQEQFWIYEEEAVNNAAMIKMYEKILTRKKLQADLKAKEELDESLCEQQAKALLEKLKYIS